MSPMQQAFVREYLVDLNATQAAIRAGYSVDTAGQKGHGLLDHPEVSAALKIAFDERATRTKIDADYVLRQAVKLHERCMQEVRPKLDRRGQQIRDEDGQPVYEFNSMGAARSLELVGKHVGVQAFKEKVDFTGVVTGTVSIEGLTPEQLEAIASASIK